jgi:hypothetical protein
MCLLASTQLEIRGDFKKVERLSIFYLRMSYMHCTVLLRSSEYAGLFMC